MYVNDVANDVDSNVHVKLFADDCVIYSVARATPEQAALSDQFCKLGEWFESWHMQIIIGRILFYRNKQKKRI